MAQTNMGPQALDAELCCKVSVKIGINEHTLPQHSTSSSAHFTLRKVQHSWLRIGLKSMLAGQLHVSGASCKCDWGPEFANVHNATLLAAAKDLQMRH